jgi:hypothetical protein
LARLGTASFGAVVSIGFFQPFELADDGDLFQIRKATLKPLKIIAKCAQGSDGSRSVPFHQGAPQVFLDESASDSVDVHLEHSATLDSISDSKA